MKRENLLRRTLRRAAVLSLILFACGAAARAQSGAITPIFECLAPDADNPGFTRVYLGYSNTTGATQTLPGGTTVNFFSPSPSFRGQPSVFYNGEHRIDFSILVNFNAAPSLTWKVGGGNSGLPARSITFSTASAQCRTGTITYQGRLTNGGAAASGNYDLQFQLFDQQANGNADSASVAQTNVPVTNGVFTVSIDFGAAALTTPHKQFLEIGVRPAGGSGAYTILAPRQPLTETPAAVFAAFAASASDADKLGGVRAALYIQSGDARLSDARPPTAGSANYIQNTTTQQTSTNFNISGSGTIGDTLTAGKVAVNGGILARGGEPGRFGANNNGYAFNDNGGDNDSGMFSLGNGQVSLFTNSAERVRVTDGGLQVFGTLTANAKNFKIDHPLDPLNKTLTYTSVESPDMKNIYDGNITTNAEGEAIVTMPAYFEALNKDFRYQLTVIGTFAQAIVAEEITGNTFKIKTDKPNVKVSWQVTGIRHDKFAEDKQTQVEQEKSAADKGKCLYAPACDKEKQ